MAQGSTFTGQVYLGTDATARSLRSVTGVPSFAAGDQQGDLAVSDNGQIYACDGANWSPLVNADGQTTMTSPLNVQRLTSGAVLLGSDGQGNQITVDPRFVVTEDVSSGAGLRAVLGIGSGTVRLTAENQSLQPTALNLAIGALQINNAPGTSGQVLTSTGASTAPSWQNPTGGGGTTGSATTTDATPTALVTLSPGVDTANVYNATISAKKQGAASVASYGLVGTFRNAGGTVTQAGSTTSLWSVEDVAGLDAVFAVSGANVVVQVTGEAAPGPVVISPVAPPTPSGATWTVGTLGGENFTDLTSALASPSVVNGDRLLLSAQTFTVNAVITVNKSITIQGASLAGTILQTPGAGADPVTVLDVTVSNVTIRDLTVKQRRTTNTSIETAIAINPAGGGAGSTGHYVEAVRVETMEFGIVIRSDGWQINNCQLAYTGPNNSNRRLLGIYRSAGQGLFTNSTYDSGQNGVITGNTQVVYVTTGAAPPTEVLGGYLRVGNVTPSNAFPVHQFFVCNYFAPAVTPLSLVVDNCTASETSLFVGFVLNATQPPLTQCAYIALNNNVLTNTHGKGALALAGNAGQPLAAPGTTTYYAQGNTLGSTTFIAGWATGINPSGVPATDALLGTQVAFWSDPNQAITAQAASWDWTATVTTQTAP